MSSSSVTTFPQKTRAAASMSSPNIVNLLGFPTRTYPVEPHGASTEIRSEKWSTVDLDYCTTSKWKSLINSSSGRHQYIRFVRCMVRRISFNASNDAEIQAFSELILSDENEEFLWVAMPELPDCEQLPSDGPWHTQLLQLVTLLRPTVIRRKKNYRKHLHKRQRSSETQPPVDLSQLNLGLDRKQQTAFAQSWFAGRNSEEPIGADQERLFKSHIALAYPAPAVEHTEAQMQKVFGQPTRVDDMGLPFDLCFSGEELPGEFDLSGLPFFSPSSGVEPPGASRRYPPENPRSQPFDNQPTQTNKSPVTVLRAHKSVAQNLVNAGRTTAPVPPSTADVQSSQNIPPEEHAQTRQENVVPRTTSAERSSSHIQNITEKPRARDFGKNVAPTQPSKPTSHALATGLSDSQAAYISDRLNQQALPQPPDPLTPIAESISVQEYDNRPPPTFTSEQLTDHIIKGPPDPTSPTAESNSSQESDQQPSPPFTSEHLADYIIKGHTDPTYRLHIPREKLLEDRARITPKPSPYGGDYLGPEFGTSIDSSVNQYYIGRMTPGPGHVPSEITQIGFRPDKDAWKWLLNYSGAPLSRRDEEWMQGMREREREKEKAVMRRKEQEMVNREDRNEDRAAAAEGSSRMAQEEKVDVVGGILKPEAGPKRPKVMKRVSFKEELG